MMPNAKVSNESSRKLLVIDHLKMSVLARHHSNAKLAINSTTGTMNPSPENRSSEVQARLPSEPGAGAQDAISQLSNDEISKPSVVVSSHLSRKFAGRLEYDDEKSLDAAIEEARRVLPQTQNAYKATGKTTVMAVLLMLIATPIVLLVLLGVCGVLCWGWLHVEATFSPDQSYGSSRLAGLLSLFLDLILVVLMVAIPMFAFSVVSKWTKNRNPVMPAILAGVVDLLVAVALFVPVWHGETLAPTHLTFLFIPVRWLLIVIGGVLVPFLGAAVVYGKVAEQKFCEETGCFLKKFGEKRIAFDLGENALALLKRGQYAAALRLPKMPETESKQKHWAAVSLWWKEQAATVFLELNMRFHGKSKLQKPKDKTKDWLAFSTRLDRSQAEILSQEFLT